MMPGTRKTVEATKMRTMRMGFLGREGIEKAGRQIRTQGLVGSCSTDAGFAGFCRLRVEKRGQRRCKRSPAVEGKGASLEVAKEEVAKEVLCSELDVAQDGA
jgi:hypothetical protein